MARDFMGLNSKDAMVVVKEEVVETSVDSESPQGSGVPLPASRKVSTLSHFTSLKTAQDKKPTNHVADFSCDRQPCQLQTLHSSPLCHDAKMPPYSMGSSSIKNLFVGGGQNFACLTMNQQFLAGAPVMNPHSVLPCGFLAGTTEPQLNPKASGAAAQLTLFYAGKVHVYDGISPETAQAIVILAGNRCNPSNLAQPKDLVQTSPSKLEAEDGAFTNKFMNTPLPSAISSPVSISSHPVGQTVVGSTFINETKTCKTADVSSTIKPKVETPIEIPQLIPSLRPVPASTIMPSAVPQARKASLARFLEMRKERVRNSSPYRLRKVAETTTVAESNHVDISPSSGSVSAGKETSNEV